MLVLKRRREQSVRIGPDVTVTVVKIEPGSVLLGISAPRELGIWRAGMVIDPSEPVGALCSACSQRMEPTASEL